MKKSTQQLIEKLAKSTDNVTKAKNPTQREAAAKFLVMRLQELDREKRELALWLEEADGYIRTTMPEINTDAAHEYNREWVRKLRQYEQINNVIDEGWRVRHMAGSA